MKVVLLLTFLINYNNVSAKEDYHFLGLGDSITSGYGISNEQDNYVNIINNYLVNKYLDKNIILSNEAIDGLTSSDLLTNILHNDLTKEKIKEADLIVLSIGGNDYLDELVKVINSKYENMDNFIKIGNDLTTNLENIYNAIFNINSDTFVIVIPLYNPYILLLEDNESLIEIFDQSKENFNKQIKSYRNVNSKKIYTLVGLSSEIESGNNLNAGIDPHPNINGHKLIAERGIDLLDNIQLIADENNEDDLIVEDNPIVEEEAVVTEEKGKSFLNKYMPYLIIVGLIIIAFTLEKSYNNVRK